MKKTISVNYNIKYQRQPGHGVTNDLLFLQKNKLAAVMEYKKDGFSNQRSIVVPRSVQEMQATNELTRLLYVTDIGYYPNAVGHYRTRSEGSPPPSTSLSIVLTAKAGSALTVAGRTCRKGSSSCSKPACRIPMPHRAPTRGAFIGFTLRVNRATCSAPCSTTSSKLPKPPRPGCRSASPFLRKSS